MSADNGVSSFNKNGDYRYLIDFFRLKKHQTPNTKHHLVRFSTNLELE